ncbi:MAG: hypothetical protein IPK67_02550 [Planctomycetes bacterium]|nr:hypothetical protein [Planctomycetota bacterium]
MSDTKNSPPPKAPHTAVHDTLGIVLIILGAFLGVAAVMFIRKGAPENPALPAALMISSVELLGPPTILWLCLGFVFVGGRLFLFGGEKNLLRDGLGFLFTGLGLSIVMGAFSPVQGGSIGNGVGGVVHPVVGVLLGGATVLAAAWVAWLRVAPPDLVARASALVGDGPGAETGGAPEARSGNRSAPRGKLPSEDPSGVTTAEADALLPDADRDEILAALRAANRNSASTVNRAPSPYPPDVRRDGGIPEGARPIEAPHEHKRPEPAPEPKAQHGAQPAPSSGAAASADGGTRGAAAVHVWNAPKQAAGPFAAGSDLAVDAHAGSPAGTQAAPAQGLSSPAAGTAASARPASPAPATKPQRPSSPPQSRTALEMAHAVPIPSPAGSPTTPTWERDEELETPGVAAAPEAPSSAAPEEVRPPSDAEVVDAYGTPLELVAELRGQPAGPQVREEDEPRPVARPVARPSPGPRPRPRPRPMPRPSRP